ncbi:16S rRNA (uracil(1498)-N(3))-methyltransferase [Lactiplantibacillus sp. WILCCON 0030]|uniref:Ribosomal RNA small subunit methyltransferase E n=1 Tax=Lactiplantibacillus brownii TaxID=3069269 RepID=A0ABU1A9E2_9LACO|nr:16S rRNA (uracil(1498)-N(3))-methyltransferase [Lactiplantibacillus brownii]MDQ7937486.1 16S rRNA (uracil(1498)-N(3))-methyltransferase [Lactiplantibacillus brownii]
MQRYFLTNTITTTVDSVFELTGESVHHWLKVMRAQPGDQAEFVTRNQQVVIGKLLSSTTTTAQVAVQQVTTPQVELPLQVLIACGVSKGDKTEQIVQRGTELGAAGFIFFDSQYAVAKWATNKRERKLSRLVKIAQAAAEQSHRTVVPTVSYQANLSTLVQQVSYDAGIVAWEESAKQGESSQLVQTLNKMQPQQRLLAIFGPEGGLTSTEVSDLNQVGVVSAGLGPRIMRAETAPMYLLSAVSFSQELV